MDLELATAAVLKYLTNRGVGEPEGVMLISSQTIKKSYGWIFFYNSKAYVETGDIMTALVGHGPVILLADTGEIVECGSLLPGEEQVLRFEQERGLSGVWQP